jgi:hypothetical protein
MQQQDIQQPDVAHQDSESSMQQRQHFTHLLKRENLRKLRKVPHPFHKSIRGLLFKTVRTYVVSSLVVIIAMAILVSLFFYAVWNQTSYYSTKIGVAIVNRDSGNFGAILAGAFLKAPPYDYYVPESHIDDLEKYVEAGHCYIGIEIPANFSNHLIASLYHGVPYQNNSIQVIFDEGRAYTTLVTARRVIAQVISTVSLNVAQTIVVNHTYVAGADPSAIVNPFQSREVNLHPVKHNGQEMASSLTYTYLALFAMIGVNNILTAWKPLEGRILPSQMIALRVGMGMLYSGLLSLILSLLILAFGSQFEKGFGVFWLFNWLVMCSFASFFAFVAVTLGPAGSALSSLFLSLNMTSSGALVNSDVMPKLLKFGMGLPMFHAVKGSKTIYYGSYNKLYMNIPVIIAWAVIFLVLAIISAWLKFAIIILKSVPEDIANSVQLDPPVPQEIVTNKVDQHPAEFPTVEEVEVVSDDTHSEELGDQNIQA